MFLIKMMSGEDKPDGQNDKLRVGANQQLGERQVLS